MGAHENLAVHRAWTDAEDRHDLTRHAEFVHADIEVRMPGAEPMIGLDMYVAMMESTYAGLSDWHVVLDDEFATDDRVVCRWRMSGTHAGELFGYPATNKHVEFSGISLWEFDAGKARRGFVMPDLAAVMGQLAA
jgi:steroid delta-isomerase-like uncharacterized protein